MDLDIAALGQVVEGLVLFDEVLIPDLGHRLNVPAAGGLFGSAVNVPAIEPDIAEAVKEQSRQWLSAGPETNLDSLVELVGGVRDVRRFSSGSYDVWEVIGVRDRYNSPVIDWIRAIQSEGPVPPVENWGTWHNSSAEARAFCSNLVWLSYRARCYDLLCRNIEVPYMPHPLRAKMAGFSSFRDIPPQSPRFRLERKPVMRAYLDAIDKVHEESRETVSHVLDGAFLPLQCSSLLPYVIRKAGSRENVLSVTYEIRESRGARDLRSHVSELEQHIDAGNLKAALRLTEEINRLTEQFRRQLGLVDVQPPNMTISIGGIVSMDISGGIVKKLTTKLARRIGVARPRTMFLRNVLDGLSSAATLGALYEVLYPNPSQPQRQSDRIRRWWRRRRDG
ncbi:hypothetical protein [Actinacidiphila glaucinigra]|uniref:hypothetical protein n=1 Tax=Actinacidiphila glaucinigra TaxID=235986 RepID=UPI00117E4FDB|nr:hypothetical protein [Actinacidiphila glaucinigra]